MRHIKGIDGIRAIAVLLVVMQHYVASYLFRTDSNIGSIGVTVFFVISGFLITSILLNQKNKKDVSTKENLAKFYIRRTLRIFPIYYFVIIIGVITQTYWFVQVSPLWHALYATNILMFITNSGVGYTSHFWSLCVEEQFYLIWPMVILLTSQKHLLKAISIAICIAPLTVILGPIIGYQGLQVYVLPFSHFDALGMGALLAYIVCFHQNRVPSYKLASGIAQLSAIILLTSIVSQQAFAEKIAAAQIYIIMNISCIVLTASVITMIISRQNCIICLALEFSPLRYLGKISYGLYLYHNLVPELFIYTPFSPREPQSITSMTVYLAATLVISAISWKFIESPIIGLKPKAEKLLLRQRKSQQVETTT